MDFGLLFFQGAKVGVARRVTQRALLEPVDGDLGASYVHLDDDRR